jgi:hypothetical protein
LIIRCFELVHSVLEEKMQDGPHDGCDNDENTQYDRPIAFEELLQVLESHLAFPPQIGSQQPNYCLRRFQTSTFRTHSLPPNNTLCLISHSENSRE